MVYKERSTKMRKVLAAVMMIGIVMTLAACGGGTTTDGGWLAQEQGEVYFLQINNGTGSVDYANQRNGQINRFHGEIVVHNDGTIEVDGMVDGQLKDCSACPYQLTNGNLVIDYKYQSYGVGGGTVSGTMTLLPSDASTYQQNVQKLNP
jgi:hypothetical protein